MSTTHASDNDDVEPDDFIVAQPSIRINRKLEPAPDPADPNFFRVGALKIRKTSLLTALLYGFRHHTGVKAKEYYFWRVADELWNLREDIPDAMFERNPWSSRMIRESIKNKYLAIGGAANSAKSHTMAGYAIVKWLSDPSNTLVLITSTTLIEAKKRIWGSVIKLISVIEDIAPCKIRDSIGSIAYQNEKGRLYDTAGLSLVAAEKSRTRDAVGKLIGIKAGKRGTVIVIADELSELSPAIIEACMSNLSKNPHLEVKAMTNPNSRFDAFGDWATPKDGWDSVNVMVDDEWWTSRGGKYIRFDGERSPNIDAGYIKYTYLPTAEQMEEDRANMGPESRGYMRMVRAIFFDADEADVIFTEADLSRSGATGRAVWRDRPKLVVGVDLGFSSGGDRSIMAIGAVGTLEDGRMGFEFQRFIPLFDDASDKATPRSYQIAAQIKSWCIKLGVPPEDVALDSTGAGEPFCDVLAGEWSPRFQRVSFGGNPSELRVSETNAKTGRDLYVNRVSELWYVGKELMRTRQLRGVGAELASEMVKRSFDYKKQGGGLRIFIEPKAAFKARIGRSPDMADAGFLALDVARLRYGLFAAAPPPEGESGFRRPYQKRSIRDLDEAFYNEEAELPASTYGNYEAA